MMNIKRLLSRSDPIEDRTPDRYDDDLAKAQQLEAEARKFLETPIGKYLIEKIKRERADAMLELTKCDAWNIKDVSKAQEKYQIAAKVETWIVQAILEGQQATNIIEQRSIENG